MASQCACTGDGEVSSSVESEFPAVVELLVGIPVVVIISVVCWLWEL